MVTPTAPAPAGAVESASGPAAAPLSTGRLLLTAATAGIVFSLVVATQNYSAVRAAGVGLSWLDLFLGELPVWLGWAALVPPIFALSRRFPLPGRWRNLPVHAAAALGAILLVLLFMVAVRRLLGLPPELAGDGYWRTVLGGLRRVFAAFLPLYGLIVAAERALAFAARARDRDLLASRLREHLHQARLENLRSQLRPHFLFNALHAISALMGRDPRRARRMIARLSELLRLSLEGGDDHFTALSRELEMLESYVALQELRFGDRLRVDVRVDPGAWEAKVPRILLQPLVENCIHHALERRSGACSVEIEARIAAGSGAATEPGAGPGDRPAPGPGVGARRPGGTLLLRVADDGPGFGGRRSEGVGLGNTRARLAALYGAGARLSAADRDGGGAEVTVELPLETVGRRLEVPR